MAKEFKLPALAENVDEVSVTKIFVSKGDQIEKDQPVIEIETDKAAAEVPSEVSGTVTEIRAKEGSKLRVGEVVLIVEEDGESKEADETPAKEREKKSEKAEEKKPVKSKAEDKKSKKAPAEKKRSEEPEDDESAEPEEAETTDEEESDESTEEEESGEAESGEKAAAPPARRSTGGPVPAAPSVRRLAREIGVDVTEVPGSGPGGRISMEDVKAYSRRVNTDVRGISGGVMSTRTPLPDFSRWGEVERQALNSVRRRTAENMAASWAQVPHVTQFDKADITQIEELRRQYGKRVEEQGGKLTATAIIVKVLVSALKKFPQFNASLDLANNEVIYKQYYNIGVAVDTDRGLLVPVIHNADQKNIVEIAVELSALAERARQRKSKLEEMQGGTFTVSNLGGIGGTAFTPIVNPPEVAILGISRSSVEPVFVDGAFKPRTMLPLAVSYDHRVIDGADGARFMRWLVEALEQPFLLFLEG
jgi:pyruvate dehydrogenase E2 component (dihydrolipoamide acetyltransferase)